MEPYLTVTENGTYITSCIHTYIHTCPLLCTCKMEEHVQAKDPQESQAHHKTVLVCLGERGKVTFSSEGGKEGNITALLDAVVNVFADVPSENPMQQQILQTRINTGVESSLMPRERLQTNLSKGQL